MLVENIVNHQNILGLLAKQNRKKTIHNLGAFNSNIASLRDVTSYMISSVCYNGCCYRRESGAEGSTFLLPSHIMSVGSCRICSATFIYWDTGKLDEPSRVRAQSGWFRVGGDE